MSGGTTRRPVSSGSGPPPPRRPPAHEEAAGEAAVEGSRAEPVIGAAPVDAGPVVLPPVVGPAPPDRPGPSRRAGSRRAPWWLRLAAWVVAVPLGLALVGAPAREAGYLSGQRLLDIMIDEDLGRFVPLVVIVAAWALVTAILVQAIVEGGTWVLRRRWDRRSTSAGSGAGTRGSF